MAVAGVVSTAGASFAGSATLDLSGTVESSCEFDESNYINSEPAITTNGISPNAGMLWVGTFIVSCNHGGQVNITVDSVTESGQVAATRNQSTYYGEYFAVDEDSTSQILWSNGSNIPTTPSPTPYNTGFLRYSFSLSTNPNPGETGLVAGDYGYTIQMTATPN